VNFNGPKMGYMATRQGEVAAMNLAAEIDGHEPVSRYSHELKLVIDEAGLVGSRQMGRVLSHAAEVGAKVVLVGDPEQLQAIEAGAVDLVQKPTALASDDLLGMREELTEKVKTAAGALLNHVHSAPEKVQPVHVSGGKLEVDIVVLGISTGGPQALRYLLAQFDADFPVPMAIVLHMPVGYTAMFAQKLDELSSLKVCEAQGGELLEAGKVFLAQAGRHLVLERTAGGAVMTQLATEPMDKPHRPSVDVLFQSAAEVYRSRVLGVVMTGMGDDGKQGSAWIKAQGGRIITEAEKSCIIYGMPRGVVESGLSDASFPLDEMAHGITKYL